MALGDGRNNAALAGLIGQLARRPMADGAFRRRRWLTGQRDDGAPRLGATGRRGARPRGIVSAFRDGAALAFEPVAAPAPDRGACRAKAACHVGCREALSQEEDNLCPKTQVLGRLVGTDHRVESLALLLREWYCRRLGSRHSRLLYASRSVV